MPGETSTSHNTRFVSKQEHLFHLAHLVFLPDWKILMSKVCSSNFFGVVYIIVSSEKLHSIYVVGVLPFYTVSLKNQTQKTKKTHNYWSMQSIYQLLLQMYVVVTYETYQKLQNLSTIIRKIYWNMTCGEVKSLYAKPICKFIAAHTVLQRKGNTWFALINQVMSFSALNSFQVFYK